ncbi:MAG: LysM peptidoglycan-binding domain-containing protein [Blautia sp.]|nr:LysM peptidoglycan-binding domain-containing protein [Blautia sp.]
MRKRVITAFVLAAALAFAPVSGELAMTANAEENTVASTATVSDGDATVSGGDGTVSDGDATVPGGDDTVSGGDATVPGGDDTVSGGDATVPGGDTGEGGSTETTGKTQLETPTGLQWDENGRAIWNDVEHTGGRYSLELYRGEERLALTSAGGSSMVLRAYFNESGAYRFRVRSRASYDPDHYTDSEWSEWSSVYDYVRPDKALGSTACYWSDTEPGTICWQPVEGAGGYEVTLRWEDSNSWTRTTIYSPSWTSNDWTSTIERYGAGRYYCTVRALSADITSIANGTEGAASDIYDTAATADVISGSISSAVDGSETSAEALETIKSTIDTTALRTAMQTDDTVLSQIRDLESAYAAEQNIKVNAPTVSSEAASYVDAEKISVVGAGLNAAAGQEVSLEVSVPAAEKVVPAKTYANSVQLEIQLKRGGESVHELDIPVTITIPVPKGLDVSRLDILHYSEDGSYRRVNFKNNGDGTVTFTVSEFSTFAFAERSASGGHSGSGSSGNGSSGGSSAGASDSQDDIVNRIRSASSGETIRVRGVNTLSNSVMQELLKKGDVTLVLEYTYKDVDYVVTIPAGAAVDADIPWYGPLYLAGRYGNGTAAAASAAGGSYTVKSGDTMSRIARANGMTLNQLAAKNPQVKDINYIVVGQKINVR